MPPTPADPTDPADPKATRNRRRLRIAVVVVGFLLFLVTADLARLVCGGPHVPLPLGPSYQSAQAGRQRAATGADSTLAPRNPLKGFAPPPEPAEAAQTPEPSSAGPETPSADLPPRLKERQRQQALRARAEQIEQVRSNRMARIYRTQCATCHGQGGRGHGPYAGAAPIDDFSDPTYWEAFDPQRARQVILEGTNPNKGSLGVMPPYRGQLDGDDVDAMIGYLRGFAKKE